MIPIEQGMKFKSIHSDLVFTIHKVEEDIIQVTFYGELAEYTRDEFNEINNDLYQLADNESIK
jgi:hypothetical protein